METDSEGLRVDQLPRQATKLVVVTPSHQFPSGVVMSLTRRLEPLEWAKRTGAWIFEDNYDAEFNAGKRTDPDLCSLDLAERTIYPGSFSKTLFPSLRPGYIICPAGLRSDLILAKLLDDLASPTIDAARRPSINAMFEFTFKPRNATTNPRESRQRMPWEWCRCYRPTPCAAPHPQ